MSADAPHRQLARLELGRNAVVEAGAGTGKTTLLTDRIIFLLLGREPALSVTQVVALTFTDKAAAEIKLRLSERLSELAALLGGAPLAEEARAKAESLARELRERFGRKDAHLRELARAALEDLDKSQIGTIHSFAAHLLRLHPLDAGVDPDFTIDREGDMLDEKFAEAWVRWLDVELGEEAPRREEWLAALPLAPLKDLESMAKALCAEGVDAKRLGGPDPVSAQWLEELAARLKAAREAETAAPAGNSKIDADLKAVLERLTSLARVAREERPPLPERLDSLELSSAKWSSKWDPAGAELYETAKAVAESASPAGEALLRRAVRLLAPFVGEFRRGYRRAGFVSSDGLLSAARDLLRDNAAVREELKGRFAALLIDEFQDTDPLQGELLLYLAESFGGKAGRWEDTKLAPGRLFVVGDPKQSIYRFRGADIAAYQRFTKHVLSQKGAVACDLTSNFRSPAAVLEPINALFAELMREEAGLQAPYKALSAREGATGAIELVQIAPPAGAKKPPADAAQRAEARWIARWLSDNCGPGKPKRFKDAAVLVRSSTPVPALLDAFRDFGVPYVVDVEKDFYGVQEIVDLVNVLRVLDDPEDKISLAGLLRGPLCLLPDASLYRLAREGALSYRKDPALPSAERERVARLFEALRRLRARVGRVPLGRLVRAALEETGLLVLAAKAYQGRQTVSNLLKFARLAEESSQRRGATLKEFIQRIWEESREAKGEGESPLADDHLEAVRVLTIHKAKGLEFPIVFLANASGKTGGGKKPVLLADWGSGASGLRLGSSGAAGATWARLLQRENEREERESVRVLYVALTRARERLFVLGRANGDSGSLSSLLARAGGWPDAGHSDTFALAGKFPVRVHLVPWEDKPAPASKRALEAGREVPNPGALAAGWLKRKKALERSAARTWTSSPSHLLKPSASAGKPWNPETVAPAVKLGNLCHKVLQNWDFKNGGDLTAVVSKVRAALELFEPGEGWDDAQSEAVEILEAFLASKTAKRLAKAEILGREIPFAYDDGGTVMRGSIDLLIREGKTITVVDYKTDRAATKDYEPQGKVYRAAVEKALGAKDARWELIFLRRPD